MARFILRRREREEQEQEALAAASIVPIYATVSSGSCVYADFWGDDPGKESAEAWKEFLAIENDEWTDEKEMDHARADIKTSPVEIGSSCERLVGNFCSKMSACIFLQSHILAEPAIFLQSSPRFALFLQRSPVSIYKATYKGLDLPYSCRAENKLKEAKTGANKLKEAKTDE